MKKPILLLIGGASGSGKTTIAQMLASRLSPKIKTEVICQDSYYVDRPNATESMIEDNFNYDNPVAFDWELLKKQINDMLEHKQIFTPVYDYNKKVKIMDVNKVEPCDLIILEGIYAIYDKELNNKSFLKIFVETAKDECLARRIERDLKHRGRTVDSILHQWREIVRPMYDQFIEPLKLTADIIIPWNILGNENALETLKLAIENYFHE
ncbi:MAG: uridine kinase [Ureaplasma sp.]|nr:uridine kinase [Ureaplasma sp.]